MSITNITMPKKAPAGEQPKRYAAKVKHRVAGIPCLIGVIDYDCVKGSYSRNADSDLDFYGWTDVEYDILDRKGRRALWLERKVNDSEHNDIVKAVADYYEQEARYAY